MLTFLPNPYRESVKKEYQRRVLAVDLGLLAALFLSACALFAPSYLILSVKDAAASLTAKSAATAGAESDSSIEARIKDIKSKTSLLKTTSDDQSMVSVLGRVTARLVPGISLSGITLKRSTSQGSIVVSGLALTRDAMVSFSKSLQGEPSFKNVALPVSSLAKSSNIGFSISIDSSF